MADNESTATSTAEALEASTQGRSITIKEVLYTIEGEDNMLFAVHSPDAKQLAYLAGNCAACTIAKDFEERQHERKHS